MYQFLKNQLTAPAGIWAQRLASLVLCGFSAVYFRSLYLPFFHLTTLFPKLVVSGIVSLLLAVCFAPLLGLLIKHLGKVTRFSLFFSVFSLINFFILFDTGESVCPTPPTKLLLAGITALGAFQLCWGMKSPRMEKYLSPSVSVWVCIISLYSSLASFAQRFFLNGNTRMHFSAEGTFYCISGFFWFIPVILLGLYLLESLSALVPGKTTGRLSRKASWWILFGCLAGVQAVILWILWPGGFPDDAYNQLRQALGLVPLNDWHPVLVTLIQRLIMSLFGNAGMIVAIQMLLFVWLLTTVLMMGYDHGVPLWLLCLGGGIFLALPNQALSWSNAMKDYAFTMALLWGTYLLLQLVFQTPWTKKISFWACLSLDLFLTVGLRHNGIVPFAAAGIACVVITVRNFSQFRFRAVGAFAAAVLALVIYKGPVFTMLDVIPNIQSPYTSMLCAVGSYINKGLPLSEEATEIMETVIPMEDWADYYERYGGHDTYYWGRPADSVEYDTSQITAAKAFRVYLEALFKAPDVVIKDRLDGMDILWDLTMPADSFNGNGFHYVFTYDEPLDCIPIEGFRHEFAWGNRYYKTTPLAESYYRTTSTDPHGAFNILLWRSGAYMIALMVLLVFWWRNRMGSMYLAFAPLLGNGFASVLTVYHQSFRYVYFIQILTLTLMFATILLGHSHTTKGEKNEQ